MGHLSWLRFYEERACWKLPSAKVVPLSDPNIPRWKAASATRRQRVPFPPAGPGSTDGLQEHRVGGWGEMLQPCTANIPNRLI